ncbi:MAG: hypothetical protein HFI72_07680 [Peptococcaceae bacterium]|jgi:hypothetical protein|nr:hypothetical protein [Peptococcaceae bacterium]
MKKRYWKKKKKQSEQTEPSLTLYLTEETAEEFIDEGAISRKENNPEVIVDYGHSLRWGSNMLAVVISGLLIGSCYLQYALPPMALQYAEIPGEDSLDQPLAVDVKNEGLFASLTIEVCDYDNLKEAHLLVNGEVAGTFHGKQLVVRVYPGDMLEIDTSAYLNTCRFRITKKSSHIREETIAEEIITENGYGWIGKISFK